MFTFSKLLDSPEVYTDFVFALWHYRILGMFLHVSRLIQIQKLCLSWEGFLQHSSEVCLLRSVVK